MWTDLLDYIYKIREYANKNGKISKYTVYNKLHDRMNVKLAFIVVVILQFLDIVYTYSILKLYISYNPEDKDWADLEFNKSARWVFKKYGLGKKSFIINVVYTAILMLIFFSTVYILNFDMKFFVYATFGGLAVVNISHYEHYKRLKEKLKETNK